MNIERRLDLLHKTIQAAAKGPCEMLTKRKLSKTDLTLTIDLLNQAKRHAEELVK